MKRKFKFAKIPLLLLMATLIFAMTACNFGGQLKLTSFVVNRASVKTEYVVGEEIDFKNISAEAKYNDASLNKVYTYTELIITYDPDITATPGVKYVTVSFDDPNLNVIQETKVQIVVNEDPNAVKHQSYIIKTGSMDKDYFIGETVDFTGVKLYEKMTDGSEIEITDLKDLVYNYDASTVTATSGMKVITLTYKGEAVSNSITINVKAPAVTSAVLDTSAVIKNYTVGDTITSFAGLTATVSYENGKTETVTDFTYLTDLSTLTAEYGEKTVKVKFAGAVERTFNIIVDGVTGYVLNTDNVSTSYKVGDTLDLSAITVTENHYVAANTRTLGYSDLTLEGAAGATDSNGTKNIVVKVGDVTVGDFDIFVSDIVATFTITAGGAALSYRVGDAFVAADELGGVVVTVTYDNGDPNKTLTYSDLTFTVPENLTATSGNKTIKVSYNDDVTGLTLSDNIDVVVHGISRYEIDTTDMNLSYIAGGSIDYTGLKVYAIYTDGGEKVSVDVATLTLPADSVIAAEGSPVGDVLLDGKEIGTITFTVEKNSIVKAEVLGTYKNVFEQNATVNAAVDFTELYVKLTYKSGLTVDIPLAKLVLSTIDTSTVGTKTVTVSFKDELNGNEDGSTTFSVNVTDPRMAISLFSKPESIVAYEGNNNDAGSKNYGDNGFAGIYVNKKDYYTVGYYNNFKFLPVLKTVSTGGVNSHSSYYSDVDIFAIEGGNYTKLTEVSDPGSTNVTYSLGDEAMVVVNTYTGSYKFSASAIGKSFKLSVLPSSDAFIIDASVKAVTLECEIVDAYNVYDPKELSVIDNQPDWSSGAYVHYSWDDFKLANGIPIDHDNINGIVLHNNVHISADDIPEGYIYTLERDIYYYPNGEINNTADRILAPAGTRYLRDHSEIYRRISNKDFLIEGNFFKIDTVMFPLVPSPAVFGADSGRDYGADFSNTTLWRFAVTEEKGTAPADIGLVTISNIEMEGNAARNNYTDDAGNLASSGGLILMKLSDHAKVNVENVIGKSYFISYFPERYAVVNLTDVKCYNSYQNAIFTWEETTLNIKTSYFDGAGGPVIIMNSSEIDNTDVFYKPTVNIDEQTIFTTKLTGEEIWFTAVNATTVVNSIKALNAMIFSDAEINASYIDGNGKMNIQGLIMADGTDAATIITGINAVGDLSIGDDGFVRATDDPYWQFIYNTPYFQGGAAILTVNKVNGDTVDRYAIINAGDPTNPVYMKNATVVTEGSTDYAELVNAFNTADGLSLTQGGLTVQFELYHN